MAKRSKTSYYSVDPPFVYAASAIVEGIFTLFFLCTFGYSALRISKIRPIWHYYATTMSALIIGYILRIASFSIYAYYNTPEVYLSFEDRYLLMLLSAKRLEPVARLFRHVGAALCSVLLVEFGQRYSWPSNERALIIRAGRAAMWTLAGVATVLGLTHCIMAEREINPDLTVVGRLGMPRLDDVFNGSKIASVVISATLLVLFVGGLTILGMAMYASCSNPSKGRKTGPVILIEIPSLLLLASVILVIVRGWNMAEVSLLLHPYRRATRDIDWWYWAELALDRFGTWMVLFVIYRAGKKAGGG